MDFSENYCTKYSQEIQAYHFGGSRLQLSLHTVIIYTTGSTKPYCTVSQNTTHSPAAIWVHLQPIFRSLPPNIACVHFVSDGPVTQYRNKTMFYILASRLHLEVPNVEKFSWNFSESGHGKGAPDGVGAACKRTADAVVAAGGDIDSLESFVNIIQERCPGITMFTIDEKAIDEITDDIKKDVTNLKPFTGTLKIHQVKGKISRSHSKLPQGATKLVMKSLSCFCDDECQHFNLGVIRYEENLKLVVEDIYTDSENEDQANLPESTIDIAGPSSIDHYKIGDYVLVKFPVRNTEYRYAALVNEISEEEGEINVTFMKVCNDMGQTFKIVENDVSDVTFEQILRKLPKPDIVLKGKRVFYFFESPVPVFEK
nr:unnamed protein product [Callosobruchus analis]